MVRCAMSHSPCHIAYVQASRFAKNKLSFAAISTEFSKIGFRSQRASSRCTLCFQTLESNVNKERESISIVFVLLPTFCSKALESANLGQLFLINTFGQFKLRSDCFRAEIHSHPSTVTTSAGNHQTCPNSKPPSKMPIRFFA